MQESEFNPESHFEQSKSERDIRLEQVQQGFYLDHRPDDFGPTLGFTWLCDAVRENDMALAEAILKRDKKYAQQHGTINGLSGFVYPLFLVRSEAMIHLLLDHGAVINAKTLTAVESPQLVRMLLEQLLHNNENEKDFHDELNDALALALQAPRKQQDIAIARILVEHGADPEYSHAHSSGPVILELADEALERRRELGDEATAFLLWLLKEKKINPNIADRGGDTLLHKLVSMPLHENNRLVLEELLAQGANINLFNKGGGDRDLQQQGKENLYRALTGQREKGYKRIFKTALHRSMESGDIATVNFMLAHNANPKAMYSGQVAPLYYAVEQDFPEAVAALLSALKGDIAAIQQSAYHGFSPVDKAIQNGQVDIVYMIAESGGGIYLGDGKYSGAQAIEAVCMGIKDNAHFSHYDFETMKQFLITAKAVDADAWPKEDAKDPRFINLTRCLSVINSMLISLDHGHLQKNKEKGLVFSDDFPKLIHYYAKCTDNFEQPALREGFDYEEFSKALVQEVHGLYQELFAHMTKGAPITPELTLATMKAMAPKVLSALVQQQSRHAFGEQEVLESDQSVTALSTSSSIQSLLNNQRNEILAGTAPDLQDAYRKQVLEIYTAEVAKAINTVRGNNGAVNYSPLRINGKDPLTITDEAVTTLSVEAKLYNANPINFQFEIRLDSKERCIHFLLASAKSICEQVLTQIKDKAASDRYFDWNLQKEYLKVAGTLSKEVSRLNNVHKLLNHGEANSVISKTESLLEAIAAMFEDMSKDKGNTSDSDLIKLLETIYTKRLQDLEQQYGKASE